MCAAIDPLQLFADFIKSKKRVFLDLDTNEICFSHQSQRFPKRTEVLLKSSASGSTIKTTLEAVWWLLKTQGMKTAEYIAFCKRSGIPAISVIATKPLLQLLLPSTTADSGEVVFRPHDLDGGRICISDKGEISVDTSIPIEGGFSSSLMEREPKRMKLAPELMMMTMDGSSATASTTAANAFEAQFGASTTFASASAAAASASAVASASAAFAPSGSIVPALGGLTDALVAAESAALRDHHHNQLPISEMPSEMIAWDKVDQEMLDRAQNEFKSALSRLINKRDSKTNLDNGVLPRPPHPPHPPPSSSEDTSEAGKSENTASTTAKTNKFGFDFKDSESIKYLVSYDLARVARIQHSERALSTSATVMSTPASLKQKIAVTHRVPAATTAIATTATTNAADAGTFSSLLSVLHAIKTEEQRPASSTTNKHVATTTNVVKSAPGKEIPALSQPPKGKFDEAVLWKSHLGGEEDVMKQLQIDTMGSNISHAAMGPQGLIAALSSITSKPLPTAAPPPTPPPVAVATAPTTYQPQQPKKQEPKKQEPPPSSQKPQSQQQPSADQAQTQPRTSRPESKRKKAPLIIIPASKTSIITCLNIKEFLEQGVWRSSEDIRKENPNKPKMPIVVQHSGREFHIIDIGSNIPKSDWDRVVAIITNGQEWEFRGWPMQKPTEIFTRFNGFHIKFDDEKTNDNVQKWPIKVFQIGRHSSKRHLDMPVVNQLWTAVEDRLTRHA